MRSSLRGRPLQLFYARHTHSRFNMNPTRILKFALGCMLFLGKTAAFFLASSFFLSNNCPQRSKFRRGLSFPFIFFLLSYRRVFKPASEHEELKFRPSFAANNHLGTGIKAFYHQFSDLWSAIMLEPSIGKGYVDITSYEAEMQSVC